MPFIAQKRYQHNVPSLRYGLNNQQRADEISDFEMADCENISVETDSLMSAPGYVMWDNNPQPGPFYGIFQFKLADGTERLIRQRRGTLEYDDGFGNWTECTLPTSGSPAATVVLTQTLCTWASLNGIALWGNGVDYIMSSTDGIVWTLRDTLPVAKVFNNGKNRIVFGAIANSSVIWWSDINTPLTVDPASWQYIDPNNNGHVISLAKTPYGTTLIFKQTGLYEISDFFDGGLTEVNFIANIVTGGANTMITTNDSVVWLGNDGFYEYINNRVRKISGRISVTGRNSILSLNTAVGAFYNNKIYMSIPDAEIDQTYNAQEYIFDKTLPRPDDIQPYTITRNRRYYGCYGLEHYTGEGSTLVTLYAGDSRPTSTGSPAVESNLFVFINDYREPGYVSGLNGSAQEGYIITKYFTENVPYYVKRFRKFFINYLTNNDTTITIGYRFDLNGQFVEQTVTGTAGSIDWTYEDGNTGGFSEGYSFSRPSIGSNFIKIDNSERPRGIQFKIKVNQISDATILGLAFETRVKTKFK